MVYWIIEVHYTPAMGSHNITWVSDDFKILNSVNIDFLEQQKFVWFTEKYIKLKKA